MATIEETTRTTQQDRDLRGVVLDAEHRRFANLSALSVAASWRYGERISPIFIGRGAPLRPRYDAQEPPLLRCGSAL